MPKPTIFIAADHAGFALKEKIKDELTRAGHQLVDLSPHLISEDDYPVYGFAVANRVVHTKDARGILVCGSGVGISIAANRIKGARAFDAYDERTTRLAREHNNANIIALSGWHLNARQATRLIKLFLETRFSKAARHRRRVEQLG